MAQIPVRNLAGEETGVVDVSDEVFGAPVNRDSFIRRYSVCWRTGGWGRIRPRPVEMCRAVGPSRGVRKGPAGHAKAVEFHHYGEAVELFLARILAAYTQDMPKKMRRSAMRMRAFVPFRRRRDSWHRQASPWMSQAQGRWRPLSAGLGLNGDTLLVLDDNTFDTNAYSAARNLATGRFARCRKSEPFGCSQAGASGFHCAGFARSDREEVVQMEASDVLLRSDHQRKKQRPRQPCTRSRSERQELRIRATNTCFACGGMPTRFRSSRRWKIVSMFMLRASIRLGCLPRNVAPAMCESTRSAAGISRLGKRPS